MNVKFITLFLLLLPSAFAQAPTVENFTHELDGVEITYTYAGGGSYHVKYTPAGVKYRYLSGDGPEDWWGPFPYKAYKTKNGEYFLAWYEKGYGDHITQLVNLESKTLYGSGLIVKPKGTTQHFARAEIQKIVRPSARPN